ncbi:MAG TPA: hypothetical protein PK723_03720 [Candidatus Pacearchaeota archaeon]|nr:hypothetical protein [Candidatus Pacearchaeota archaeon]HPZ74909.1 hypothetical protein [Candidatus Pacearchaeota archaeon]HQD88918.1 hypothetical protein [Candidatus Pacearchaeota archaeon]
MYEDQIERLKRESQSIERDISRINYQEDILTQKIRQYQIAQQRSPQSAAAYARQIDDLERQIDKLRSDRINASSRLSQKEREISLWEKRSTEAKAKQRSQYSQGGSSIRRYGIPPRGGNDNDSSHGSSGPMGPMGPGTGTGI